MSEEKAKSINIKKPNSTDNIVHFAQTPNGTYYGFTPGGSKIKYSMSELLNLSSSPHSKQMPPSIAKLNAVLNRNADNVAKPLNTTTKVKSKKTDQNDDMLFDMDN